MPTYLSVRLSTGTDGAPPAGWPIECAEHADPTLRPGYDELLTPEALAARRTTLLTAYRDWEQAAALAAAEAQAAAEAEQRLTEILAAVTSPDVVPSAARAGLLALMLSVQEVRAKANEALTWLNANGAGIALLQTGDTFDQATEAVRQLVLSGAV